MRSGFVSEILLSPAVGASPSRARIALRGVAFGMRSPIRPGTVTSARIGYGLPCGRTPAVGAPSSSSHDEAWERRAAAGSVHRR